MQSGNPHRDNAVAGRGFARGRRGFDASMVQVRGPNEAAVLYQRQCCLTDDDQTYDNIQRLPQRTFPLANALITKRLLPSSDLRG